MRCSSQLLKQKGSSKKKENKEHDLKNNILKYSANEANAKNMIAKAKRIANNNFAPKWVTKEQILLSPSNNPNLQRRRKSHEFLSSKKKAKQLNFEEMFELKQKLLMPKKKKVSKPDNVDEVSNEDRSYLDNNIIYEPEKSNNNAYWSLNKKSVDQVVLK